MMKLQAFFQAEEINLTDAETFKTPILINDAHSAKAPSKAFEKSHLQVV